MDKDKLIVANRIIKSQSDLIQMFDNWVIEVKGNKLESASEIVKKANLLRLEIEKTKKEYEKLNKKSMIITKLN